MRGTRDCSVFEYRAKIEEDSCAKNNANRERAMQQQYCGHCKLLQISKFIDGIHYR